MIKDSEVMMKYEFNPNCTRIYWRVLANKSKLPVLRDFF